MWAQLNRYTSLTNAWIATAIRSEKTKQSLGHEPTARQLALEPIATRISRLLCSESFVARDTIHSMEWLQKNFVALLGYGDSLR